MHRKLLHFNPIGAVAFDVNLLHIHRAISLPARVIRRLVYVFLPAILLHALFRSPQLPARSQRSALLSISSSLQKVPNILRDPCVPPGAILREQVTPIDRKINTKTTRCAQEAYSVVTEDFPNISLSFGLRECWVCTRYLGRHILNFPVSLYSDAVILSFSFELNSLSSPCVVERVILFAGSNPTYNPFFNKCDDGP